MKGSLIVVGFFALGCLLGWSGYLPGVVIENDITVYVLYLLMFQVGISIGSDKKLKEILSSIRPKLLLVPLATIIGTLSFSALISLALNKWSVFDCLAVGSGFAYYSLSSILISIRSVGGREGPIAYELTEICGFILCRDRDTKQKA